MQSAHEMKPPANQLPFDIELYVPEARLYRKLVEMERQLDKKIVSKCMEIQESSFRPSRMQRILRIFVSSLVSDQTWQVGPSPSQVPIPSWTFRIEGYLVDPGSGRLLLPQIKRFSDFFRSIVVEIDPNDVVEWVKNPLSRETDGFEIKRIGDSDKTLRIHLRPEFCMDKFKCSEELCSIINLKLESKPAILLAIWRYMHASGCLTRVRDSLMVVCNGQLQRLFGCDSFDCDQLHDRLLPHFHPPDPICLEYTVRMDGLDSRSVAYDLHVEVPDPRIRNVATPHSGLIKEISFLDQKISEFVQLVHKSCVKRRFLAAFGNDPSGFIHKWLESLSKESEIVFGTAKIPLEETRKSRFFQGDWVQDAVFQYMNRISDPVLSPNK